MAHLADLFLGEANFKQAIDYGAHVAFDVQAARIGVALAELGSVGVEQGVGVHGCAGVCTREKQGCTFSTYQCQEYG